MTEGLLSCRIAGVTVPDACLRNSCNIFLSLRIVKNTSTITGSKIVPAPPVNISRTLPSGIAARYARLLVMASYNIVDRVFVGRELERLLQLGAVRLPLRIALLNNGHLGMVRGGFGTRMKPILQTGNSVAATWRARLDEHLGLYAVEGLDLRAAAYLVYAAWEWRYEPGRAQWPDRLGIAATMYLLGLYLALTGGTLSPPQFQIIREAMLRIGAGTWQWHRERLRLAIYLIVTSPDFNVLR